MNESTHALLCQTELRWFNKRPGTFLQDIDSMRTSLGLNWKRAVQTAVFPNIKKNVKIVLLLSHSFSQPTSKIKAQ